MGIVRTLARFFLALFAVVLLIGSALSSPPRHPGVCTKNDDLGYTFLTEGELKKLPVVAKNGSEFQRFLLEVPSVSFSYKGKTYDVGGSSVNVVAKWDSLPDGAAASYHRDYLKEGYQLKLDNVCRDWLIKKLIGDDCDVRNNVLHEVTHYLVDLKYNGDAESPEYRFVQEMMAHMNGGNMTEMQAAKRIAERYPKLKKLANEFLEREFGGKNAGRANSSSAVGTLKNAESTPTSSMSGTNLHAFTRNNSNSDWDCCKCATPDDKDFYCQKCGKMSSWLAPREDPEFLQSLMKRSRK